MEDEAVGSASGGFSVREEGNCSTDTTNSRMVGRRHLYDDSSQEYKSKNLHAERRRRPKLSDRLLSLRALVPRITNMKKETIIEDAITYIRELQGAVIFLSEQLLEMEPIFQEEGGKPKREETNSAAEMKKCGIEEDVRVTYIGGNKLKIEIIFEKKRGRFTKLLEAMTSLGFELGDTSVTSSKGTTLVSSFAEGTCDDTLAVEETRGLLLKIIRAI